MSGVFKSSIEKLRLLRLKLFKIDEALDPNILLWGSSLRLLKLHLKRNKAALDFIRLLVQPLIFFFLLFHNFEQEQLRILYIQNK